jgi:hypothetical protein
MTQHAHDGFMKLPREIEGNRLEIGDSHLFIDFSRIYAYASPDANV